jgi:hypothetical protein
VLNPVTGVVLDLAVISADREVDGQRSMWFQQLSTDRRLELQEISRAIELRRRDCPQSRSPLAARRDEMWLGGDDLLPTT